MKYFWALLLFALGIIFLGAEFGFWGYDQVRELWQFWPLTLVFAGLDMLTRKLKYGWIIMLATFLASGLFVYSVIFTGGNLAGIKTIYNEKREVVRSDIVVEKAENLTEQIVELETGASNVEVTESTDKLISGYMDSNIAIPRVGSGVEGGTATTKISMDSEKRYWFGNYNLKNSFFLFFNKELPLTFNIHAGASNLNLDLSEYILKELNIEIGASNIELIVGENVQDKAKITVKSGASDLKMKVPQNVNVVVESDSALSSVDSVEDIEGAEKIIYLTINSAATSVKITR